ncbi:MAG: shikimate dehydrogenase [Candidatus Obscuribacterales bacterium]|nr:shikimate dehydrogenase [Candidatus Obscuribacterales bacterium]
MSMRLALIGHPVKHSLSPPMHRAAFSYFGLQGSYELIDVEPEKLAFSIEKMQAENFSGFNVTIPHKEAVHALLSKCTLEAGLVGAVNTVRIDSAGTLHGHNTDLQGFIKALELALAGQGKNCLDLSEVLILGAGGAARACLAALLILGCKKLRLAARNTEAAERLAEEIQSKCSQLKKIDCEISVGSFEKLEAAYALAVNCTPIGLRQLELPEWGAALFAALKKDAFFFDTVYTAERQNTVFMKAAAEHKIASCDGLSMLAAQAVFAFEFWSGRSVPQALMLEALSKP